MSYNDTTPEAKREFVIQRYPGPDWFERASKMSDAQIHNIYMRLQSGEYHKPRKGAKS